MKCKWNWSNVFNMSLAYVGISAEHLKSLNLMIDKLPSDVSNEIKVDLQKFDETEDTYELMVTLAKHLKQYTPKDFDEYIAYSVITIAIVLLDSIPIAIAHIKHELLGHVFSINVDNWSSDAEKVLKCGCAACTKLGNLPFSSFSRFRLLLLPKLFGVWRRTSQMSVIFSVVSLTIIDSPCMWPLNYFGLPSSALDKPNTVTNDFACTNLRKY